MSSAEQNRNIGGKGYRNWSNIFSSNTTTNVDQTQNEPVKVWGSGGGGGGRGGHEQQQKKIELDPSLLEGCASLLDQVDKRVMVLLRDQKTLIGTLVSIDQFHNLVLADTIERLYYKNVYGDIARGTFFVRGDTVVLVGEIDHQKEFSRTCLANVPIESILEAKRIDVEAKKMLETKREKAFKDRGMAYVKEDTEGLEEF